MDTSYLVALADKKDSWYERALKIPKGLLKKGVTSDYVLSEAVTIIGHRGGGNAGFELYDFIISNLQLIYVDEDLLRQSMETYPKYDGTLSVADAVSVEIMRRRGIKKIASFDADFDKVAGISRIH